jgi:DNA-binding NarL/FixJ family response regulator/signal transduction histidine kinase
MRPLDALGIVLLLVGPAALLARRRWPVAVLATAAAAMVIYRGLEYPIGPVYLAGFVALVSAVALGHRWPSVAVVAAGGAVSVGWLALQSPGQQLPWGGIGAVTAWLAVVIAAAELWRARKQRLAQDRATQAEIARRQGSDERLRIARELHDLLGHHVSLINIQAGVALHLMDGDPEQARTALTAIKQSSRDLLHEMRTTLGVLRGIDESPPHHPVAGLAGLEELVTHTRDAGLPVEVEVHGTARELPAGVDLAAYWIVQEALTNARKHAGPAHITVRVGYRDDSLRVTVDDDAPDPVVTTRAATGWPGCANALPPSAAACKPDPAPAADSPSPHRCPPTARSTARPGDPRRAGRRPKPGPRRIPRLLNAEPDVTVVGEATDGGDALRATRDTVPDIVLMDIRMPERDGLAATRDIVADPALAGVRVIVLTTFAEDAYIFEAIRSGASGFLVKDTEPAELVHALRVVHGGDALLSPTVTRRLIEEFAARAKPPAPDAQRAALLGALTDREREVVTLVAAGLTNDEIVAQLVLSPATAKTHVSRAMIKIGARDARSSSSWPTKPDSSAPAGHDNRWADRSPGVLRVA